MLPLGGRPVLAWTLEQLCAAGIREIVINLHHAPDVITKAFGDGHSLGVRITYLYENEILGTAGGVKNAEKYLAGHPFLVVYGDNVLDWDPQRLVAEHTATSPVATIAIAEVPDPSKSGIVESDDSGRITGFREKPGSRLDLGRWVNAGVYVLDPVVLGHIPEGEFSDFGFHVFPALLAQGLRLQAYRLPAPPTAIDSPELYASAQRRWNTPI